LGRSPLAYSSNHSAEAAQKHEHAAKSDLRFERKRRMEIYAFLIITALVMPFVAVAAVARGD